MATPLDDSTLDTIFRKARTQNKWLISQFGVNARCPVTD